MRIAHSLPSIDLLVPPGGLGRTRQLRSKAGGMATPGFQPVFGSNHLDQLDPLDPFDAGVRPGAGLDHPRLTYRASLQAGSLLVYRWRRW
jgi:hypothetical protein